MSIVESIQKARKRGASDKQILQEIIKENPEKGKILAELLRKGASPTQILNRIIEQKSPPKPLPSEKLAERAEEKPEAEKREWGIEEAKKRVQALKKEIKKRRKEEKPPTPAKPLVIPPSPPKPSTLPKPPGPPTLPKPSKPIEIIRPLPKKPTFREKLWVRVLAFGSVLVLLAGVASFWYFFLVIKPKPPIGCATDADCPTGSICAINGVCVEKPTPEECTTDTDCPTGYICGTDKVCVKKPVEITIPPSLFAVETTRELAISTSEELRPLFLQTIQEWLDRGQFKRIVIKNTTENKVISLKEFFNALQIRIPEGFEEKVKNDFTLFVYSQAEGNRIGFATKVLDREGLANLLSSQETTMKDDYKPLFTLMEEEKPAIIPYFKNASQIRGYTGPNFRYQTLSHQDLGICYLVSDNYFVLTSSWQSMEKTIEKLGILGAPVEITKELKYGDREYEVELLQTWLKQDPVVYPRGLVTGFFGPLTKAAVTHFQEKYESEILIPQGLTEGTGIVDLNYTRIKLNELYGKSGIIPPTPQITTDLRYGDHGGQVRLLQTWLKQDRDVYPEGIVSGWFGPLTDAAVKRFQEKYAPEILDPQGLTRGSGIVDAFTRRKLNELYGE